MLDAWPHLTRLAELWRAGRTTDDVSHYLTFWAVYCYPADQDPREAATDWLQRFARGRAAMYGAGLYADPIVVLAGPPERQNDEALERDRGIGRSDSPRKDQIR